MRTITRKALAAVGLVGFGYLLGLTGGLDLTDAQAQQAQNGLSQQTSNQIKTALDALDAAQNALESENRYRPVIEGVNSFAVTVGGVDAVADLESGRGVDPETFAGLYAGLARDDVAQHLARDEDGRLTYKGQVVRMYSITHLEELFARRARLAGQEQDLP